LFLVPGELKEFEVELFTWEKLDYVNKIKELINNGNNNYLKYKVKDISLAEWGRKEINLAEAEMPGLMALEKSLVMKTIKRSSHCRMFTHDYSNSSFN
jgi:hypothetical protein